MPYLRADSFVKRLLRENPDDDVLRGAHERRAWLAQPPTCRRLPTRAMEMEMRPRRSIVSRFGT
jgi:hypothetical protein